VHSHRRGPRPAIAHRHGRPTVGTLSHWLFADGDRVGTRVGVSPCPPVGCPPQLSLWPECVMSGEKSERRERCPAERHSSRGRPRPYLGRISPRFLLDTFFSRPDPLPLSLAPFFLPRARPLLPTGAHTQRHTISASAQATHKPRTQCWVCGASSSELPSPPPLSEHQAPVLLPPPPPAPARTAFLNCAVSLAAPRGRPRRRRSPPPAPSAPRFARPPPPARPARQASQRFPPA